MAVRSDANWDIAVDDRNGQLVLAVEIKRKFNASPEWAAQFRSNILAHGIFPKAPYFLMAFPDKFYLWVNADSEQDQSKPTYTIDASPILQPYFQRAGIEPKQLSEGSLELILTAWLGEIIYSEQLPENVAVSQRWLLDSGLYAALAGGKIKHGLAA